MLTLTGRDGEVIAVLAAGASGDPVSRIRWPGLLGVLPAGPLRDRLDPVVGIRALLPVARAASRVREQRVLNSDDKTVARITIDQMSVSHPGRATTPPRLFLQPLRGYQAQADRLAAALAAAPGITAGAQSPLEVALAAAGRRPGDYSSKIDVELAPDGPATAALAAVLTALLDTLEANVGGTVRDTDTEFLHDLRIAVRRTRTALKLAGRALPGGLAARFRPEFKWLGDLTTPTRDLDVYLLGLSAMAAGLVAAHRGGPAAVPAAPGTAAGNGAAAARQGPALGPVHPPDRRVAHVLGEAAAGQAAAERGPAGHRADRQGAPPGDRRRRGQSPRPPPPRACMSCASAARSCATCWRSSARCTTRTGSGRRCGSSRRCRTAWASSRTPRCSAGRSGHSRRR